MSTPHENTLAFSRRRLLVAAGMYAGAATAASLFPIEAVRAATPDSAVNSNPVTTPPVAGLHLQFGSDASSRVVVSWHTLQPVCSPKVLIGSLDGRLERTVHARQVSYADAKSQRIVYAYHANIDGLKPRSEYLYCALHDGAEPQFGVFRTAPRGRAAFTFTSFGDQGTPTLSRKFVAPQGVTIPT